MQKVTSRSSILGMEKTRPEANGRNNTSTVDVGSLDVDDWRRAISTPTKYRVGSASIHLRPRDFIQIGLVLFILMLIILLYYNGRTSKEYHTSNSERYKYNNHYPLTAPTKVNGGSKYRIAVISDLDHSSKSETEKNLWMSYYLQGYLTVYNNDTFFIEWDSEPVKLHSSISQGGRGMELSELVVFDGKLITVDDRTGIIYRIKNENVIPWLILPDGAGDTNKDWEFKQGFFQSPYQIDKKTVGNVCLLKPTGFKSEWATVKDEYLYVGGLGKEWTSTTGEVLNLNPQYVKKISPSGVVQHLDWHKHYNAMKERSGIHSPGYMVHESGVWSSVHKKWFFLPRRASNDKYDDKLDEKRAANILITANEDFTSIESRKFGPSSLTHGFSSFKFIPNTNDKFILALKSEEDGDQIATYIMVFDLHGRMLTKEMKIADFKYEGVEFV